MRPASKIFRPLLAIVVLAGVGILSLRTIDRLVSNQEITTRTLPARHLATLVRESIALLEGLEERG